MTATESFAPGRLIAVNDGDSNTNGVPDFADMQHSNRFVRVELDVTKVADTIDWGTARVRFNYSASDPAQVQTNVTTVGSITVTNYVAQAGFMRLWTKDGLAQRNPASVTEGGDYVPAGVELMATNLFASGTTSLPLYVEGISPATSEYASIAATIRAGPGAPPTLQMEDEVRVSVFAQEILSVLIGEDGFPLFEGGLPLLGERLQVQEAVSLYYGDDGTDRGAPAYTTASYPDDELEITTDHCADPECDHESCESQAAMSLRGPTVTDRLLLNWSLLRDESITETKTFRWSEETVRGGTTVTNRVTLALSLQSLPGSSVYQADVVLDYPDPEDENYEPISRSYQVYRNGLSHYSNFRLDDPRETVGYPTFSSRTAFVARLVGVAPNHIDGLHLRYEIDGSEGDPDGTIPFVRSDAIGAYTEVLVPVLEGSPDASEFCSSKGFRTIRVPVLPPSAAELLKVDMPSHLIASADGIVKTPIAQIPAKLGHTWLMTGSLYGEVDSRDHRANSLRDGAQIILTHLGLQTTLALTPTRASIMELLPRHRLWYHNSHGRGDLGIEVAKIVGSSYQKDYMVGNDVSSLNIRYILVFMSTCQSTHKYAVLNPVNREYNVGQLQDLTPHRVYDFRAALDAQVYLGWDGDAFVRVLNAVNKDWPDSLRGRTIGDAIEELRDRVRVAGRSTENVVNHDAILRVVFADDSWGGKTLINKMEVAP